MISKNHGPCLILPSSGQKRMPFSQVMSRKNPWQVDVDETHSLDFKVWLEPMVWVASHPIWPRRNMGCWMDMKCGHLMGICGNWPQISQHISQISRIPPHSLNATKTAALWLSFRRSFETLAQTMATQRTHGLPGFFIDRWRDTAFQFDALGTRPYLAQNAHPHPMEQSILMGQEKWIKMHIASGIRWNKIWNDIVTYFKLVSLSLSLVSSCHDELLAWAGRCGLLQT